MSIVERTDSRITDEQIEQWRIDGYVHVPGFLTPDEVAAAHESVLLDFPTREQYDADPSRFRAVNGLVFKSLPFAGDAVNRAAFLPPVLDAVERMLGTTEIRLTQSLMRASYGGPDTVDQLLHRDFHNNSMLAPHFDGRFMQLPVILYYTDVPIECAPTYIVSNQHTKDVPLLPHHVPEETAPDAYAKQQPLLAKAGDALFYTMFTMHRGSAFLDHGAHRYVHHLAYRGAEHDWMGFTGWPYPFDTPNGQRCIEMLSPRQRELLGIPAPGHEYWTEETVRWFEIRYPEADSTPYREAIAS